jgi:hypothetical protein
MRRPLLILLCSLALGLSATIAAAAVPSPSTSTLPDCMALCPMGDLPFVVVVRDIAGNPINNSTVWLDFSQCPGASLCPPMLGDPYVVDLPNRALRGVTNASGSIDFHARVGGTGAPGSVRVFADGVPLRSYALASPDQDGDGIVGYGSGADDAMFAAKLGTTDPTADFTCDGHVDGSDLPIFNFHHSQACVGYVDPVRTRTWGSLKTHY